MAYGSLWHIFLPVPHELGKSVGLSDLWLGTLQS
jgi:hypothetical protein